MRKSLFVFVVLAMLALAVPASAQYIPQTWEGVQYRIMGNQVQMLTADNLGLVNGLTDQLRQSGYRSLARDLRWNEGYGAYGLPIGGGFYPMYDRNRKPMSKKKAAIIYGAIGAVSGELIGRYVGPGTTRNQITSTIVGAGVGALVGALTHRGNNNGVVVAPPSYEGGQQGVRIARDGTPVAVGYYSNRGGGPISTSPSATGDWRVSNRTSKRAELWDGERFIARIEPWQNVQVDAPQNGYKAVLLIPNRSGGLDQETAQIRSGNNFNGWDIVAPVVQ